MASELFKMWRDGYMGSRPFCCNWALGLCDFRGGLLVACFVFLVLFCFALILVAAVFLTSKFQFPTSDTN